LAGAQKYYYRLTVKDNFNRSTVQTGDFTTLGYAPRDITLTADEIKSDSIKLVWSINVPTGDPVTSLGLDMLDVSSGNITSYTIATSASSYTISNLQPGKDYDFYMTASNSRGVGISDPIRFTTIGNAMTLSSAEAIALTFSSIQVTAVYNAQPSAVKSFRFSIDGGET